MQNGDAMDPGKLAMLRARARQPDQDSVERDSGVVRKPGFLKRRINEDSFVPEQGDSADFVNGLTHADIHSLSDEDKNRALAVFITMFEQANAKQRELEIKDNELDLEHKRRFGDLGYVFARGGFIFAAFCVAFLISLLAYGIIFDKSLVDGGIIGAFINAFTEVLKTVFSAI